MARSDGADGAVDGDVVPQRALDSAGELRELLRLAAGEHECRGSILPELHLDGQRFGGRTRRLLGTELVEDCAPGLQAQVVEQAVEPLSCVHGNVGEPRSVGRPLRLDTMQHNAAKPTDRSSRCWTATQYGCGKGSSGRAPGARS